jgi:hypothetical protein
MAGKNPGHHGRRNLARKTTLCGTSAFDPRAALADNTPQPISRHFRKLIKKGCCGWHALSEAAYVSLPN